VRSRASRYRFCRSKFEPLPDTGEPFADIVRTATAFRQSTSGPPKNKLVSKATIGVARTSRRLSPDRQIIVCGKPARSSTAVPRLGACSTPRPGQGGAPSPGGTTHHVTCSSYRCHCRVRWSTASPLPSAPGPPRKCADPIRQVPRPSANGAAVGRVGVAGFTFGDEHLVHLRSQKAPKDLLQDSCP
jgi:hypothetical protein